ncbi:MAG: FAD-dependent oxidoreductase [Candidatus Hydrothermae bacterium]|nr:FAD-dependent oxidoreductase [Candidatus Hydrothermae bacterium]
MGTGLKNLLNPLDAVKYLFKKPHTIRLPYEPKVIANRYRGIHVNDWDLCVGCGNCARICTCQAITMVPVEGIEPKPGSTNLRPKVDYGKCSFCGQCVDVCPTGSLKLSKNFNLISTNREDYVFIPSKEWDSGPGTGWESDLEYSILNFERVEMPERPPEERRKDFEPVILGFSREQAVVEGMRCLGCALCMDGCPTRMFIPQYIEAITDGDYEKSLKIFYVNNPLPEICGTVCTHRCEDACVYSRRGQPVQIRYLKGFGASRIDDRAKVLGTKVGTKKGRVAVIGAGPAGFTVSYYLRREGFDVTIFEALSVPGGMMKVGIPRYRLSQKILDREIGFITSLGVEIKYNTRIGRDIKLSQLLKEFDAVFLGVGFHRGIKMGIPGEDGEGVMQAVDFLRKVNLGEEVKIGKRILVVGGGDVAMDATRTPLRLGAEEVILSYRRREVDMPASEEEIKEAKEEGVVFMTQTLPIEVLRDANGKVTGVKYVRTRMEDQGPGRRPKPVPIMEETFIFEVDTVIEAIGQTPDYSLMEKEIREKLTFDKSGKRVVVDENGMTSVEGLFAGGDIVNYRGDIISAVADAVKAAKGIARYLAGK